jgi:hypothetical protein
VVIALLEQLARPVACFVFSAEILRPPHPFVARGRQAIFVRNLISHAFPYRVREGAGSPRQSRNSSDWPMPRISVFELINSQLVFREMRVSGRAKKDKNCGDLVTFKKR